MNTNKLIGHKITHVSWGEGIIITADSKYITVSYSGQGEKKYQFPKAFESFLTIDEKSLQDEIREEIENLPVKEKMVIQPVRRTIQRDASSSIRNEGVNLREVPFQDRILKIGVSFTTHAEALNKCFGFNYKQYQQAYKSLNKGYAVWFPSIANKAWGEYVSTDTFSGWIKILSEDKKTLLQVDNPLYASVGTKDYDPNKRIVFAKFDKDKRYRFIGIFGAERRVSNGYEYTRLGTVIDTVTMQMMDE